MGQFTAFTGTITGQAGSLITALDAILVTGCGWTKAYSAANKAAYYSGAATVPSYLRVDDTGTQEALITGYHAMTDVDTGTFPFPTTALGVSATNAYYIVRKSAAASATTRDYIAYADAGTIYFFCKTGDSATIYLTFAFGEFDSVMAGDAYRNICIGRRATGGTVTNDCLDLGVVNNTGATYDTGYGAMDRSYTGAGNAIGIRKVFDSGFSGTGYVMGIGLLPFPNNPNGDVYVSKIRICEPTSGVYRGTFRGLWNFCHPVASVNDGDTFSGTGTLAGKTFKFIKSSGQSGLYTVETSATLTTA